MQDLCIASTSNQLDQMDNLSLEYLNKSIAEILLQWGMEDYM